MTSKLYPTLLDTKTGEKIVCSEWGDGGLFWWADGNGSCDCNRAIIFDKDEELNESLGISDNVCCGHTRFIAVDVHGDLEDFGVNKAQALDLINKSYPPELIAKFIDEMQP